MTYCVAISTREGLVFCSDSRTNAGPDMLSSYSKMHIFHPSPDQVFILMTAGNLATTQAIVSRLEQDLEAPDSVNLGSCGKMHEAARYVSNISREVQTDAQNSVNTSGIDTSASLILGGQIKGGEPALYLVYAASNFITDSDETPFLQIGESKYGRPILDRILTRTTSLEDAARCAIVSMDSTIKSNATVGPPIEVLIYEKNTFESNHHIKLDEEDQYLRDIKKSWNDALKTSFSALPRFDWEHRSSITPLQAVGTPFPNSQNDNPGSGDAG
ncbi:peptidase [Exilibacterium tricleocarpae]|uniref:Peptidase n=1 Tax=Exilibacterium tricleocarpae TaxID=2591008 RepID=A0A545U6R4_9GAMM|nr:peptidase [Exilibacterium tricleocarpae]TQV85162.1 peptidase [Exilibacterium tricleocarpae]